MQNVDYFFSCNEQQHIIPSYISLLQCLDEIAIWVFCVSLPPDPKSTDQNTSPRLSTDSPCINKYLWVMVVTGTALSVEKEWGCEVPTC